jgi:hypothetical protein
MQQNVALSFHSASSSALDFERIRTPTSTHPQALTYEATTHRTHPQQVPSSSSPFAQQQKGARDLAPSAFTLASPAPTAAPRTSTRNHTATGKSVRPLSPSPLCPAPLRSHSALSVPVPAWNSLQEAESVPQQCLPPLGTQLLGSAANGPFSADDVQGKGTHVLASSGCEYARPSEYGLHVCMS